MQYANFQKFSRGTCPRTPLESFLTLKLLKNNSSGKNTLKKSDEYWCPLPEYAPDMKHFQKAYLRPFASLNVFAFSWHLT